MKKKLAVFACATLAAAMLSMTACSKTDIPSATLPTEETAETQTTSAQEKPTDTTQSTEQEAEKPYEDAGYSITISINPLVKLFMSKDDQVLEV